MLFCEVCDHEGTEQLRMENTFMYKAGIFDLDGTLLDTLDDLADATNAALRACGYPPRSREEVRRFVGNGVHLLIERAAPHGVEEAAVERCFALFKEQYGKRMCCKTRPYSGILPLLEALREAGVQYAVVSNKYDGAVKQLSDTPVSYTHLRAHET